MNDGIRKDLCSLLYESVDDAARIIMEWGRDTELAKIDIVHAYRNIPVHPTDRHLLGRADCTLTKLSPWAKVCPQDLLHHFRYFGMGPSPSRYLLLLASHR